MRLKIIGNCCRSSNTSKTEIFSIECQYVIDHVLDGASHRNIGRMSFDAAIVAFILAVMLMRVSMHHGTIVRYYIQTMQNVRYGRHDTHYTGTFAINTAAAATAVAAAAAAAAAVNLAISEIPP